MWLSSVHRWQQWCDLWPHSSGQKEPVLREPAGWNGMCRPGNHVTSPARIIFFPPLNHKHKDYYLLANLLSDLYLFLLFVDLWVFSYFLSWSKRLTGMCECVSCPGCIPALRPVAVGIESRSELQEQTSAWKQLGVMVGGLRSNSMYAIHIRTTRGS